MLKINYTISKNGGLSQSNIKMNEKGNSPFPFFFKLLIFSPKYNFMDTENSTGFVQSLYLE
ncbi:plasmid rolling circle replication initiator protein Rep [Cytobacillus horneckiae]